MGLGLFLATLLFAGGRGAHGLLRREREQPGTRFFDELATASLLALALALALSWALAIPRVLGRGSLLAGCVAIAGAAAWFGRSEERGARAIDPLRSLVRRGRERLRGEVGAAMLPGGAAALGCLALLAWGAFALWRGATVLSPNHDGVSYHLPKAALIAVAHGYQTFDGPDARVSFWPCNYELLLADVILLDGSDVHTAWVSTASLIAFLFAVGALAERWWGGGAHVVLAMLLAGGMTLVLLLSDAHKNDLMTAALFLIAISAAARWSVEGGAARAFLAILAVAIAIGTKGSALFLVVAIAPVAVWGSIRQWRRAGRPSLARLALWGAGSVAALVMLGGAVLLFNLRDAGQLMPSGERSPLLYDAFANLWRFPYVAFLRPFSRTDDVWIPWQGMYWHDVRHDLFFSEWGLPSSVLLLAAPFGVARYARAGQAGHAGQAGLGAASPLERGLVSFSLVFAFFLFLPLRAPNIGVLGMLGLVRYTLFFPVLVALWTAVPAVAELLARGRGARLVATGALVAATLLFGGYASYEAVNDLYEPLSYVRDIADRPAERRTRRSGQNFRAGVILDRLAGPTDEVAFDGGFDGWSYYCFGPTLGRRVTYLHPDRGLPVVIPAQVKWVVIDRIVNIDLGNPSFLEKGDWSFLGRGTPTALDLAVFEQMKKDPCFRLVYSDEEKNQAVFERVSSECR